MSKIPHYVLLAKSIITHSNEDTVVRNGTDPCISLFEDKFNEIVYFSFSFPEEYVFFPFSKCFSECCSCVARGSFACIYSENNVEYLSLGIKKTPATTNLKTDGSDTIR